MIEKIAPSVRIYTGEHFLKEGIEALLRANNYDVTENDDANVDCDIVVICADDQNRLPSEASGFLASAARAKVVIFARLLNGGPLPRHVLTRAAAILDRGITARKLLVALEAVMIGVVVRDPAFFRWGHDLRDARSEPGAGSNAVVPAALPFARTFSAREREILTALTEGLSNKVIARRHDIAEATVKVHIKHILRKLNMSNRTQVAIWAKSNAEMVA